MIEKYVKKRWKSTRDYYKKLRTKFNNDFTGVSKSGAGRQDGVDDIVEYPTWPYYNGFYFILLIVFLLINAVSTDLALPVFDLLCINQLLIQ